MTARTTICFVFAVLVIISALEGAQSMLRSSPERKIVVPSRAAYERPDKAPKKQVDRTQRGRPPSRFESQESIARVVNSPSERLKKLHIPARNNSNEKLGRDYRRPANARAQKVIIATRYRSLSPEPSFARLNSSDRGHRRVPSEQELIDMRASLQPPPPDTPNEVKIQLRHGNVILSRETEVASVHHTGPDNKICSLEERDMAAVCDACTKVYEKVYKKKKYRPLDLPPKKTLCTLRSTLFGITWVDMYVRKCPFLPDFYLSQGNGDGWVFVFIPIKGSNDDLKFEVHMGEFDELLRSRRSRVVRHFDE